MIQLNIWFIFVLSVVIAALTGTCLFFFRSIKRLRRHNRRQIERNRRIEQQLLQAQRYEAVGIMAGSIVHNLNNLMSVILGHTRMVSHDLPADEPAVKDLQQVLKAGGMAADLLSEISDFSRQADQALKPSDMALAVRDTLKFLRDITPTNIRIREDLPAASEPVLASSTGLQQILMNLVSNSVRAIGKGTGLIEVIVRDSVIEHVHEAVPQPLEAGHYLRLTVRDNGQGIPRDTLGRIQGAFRTQPPDTTHVGLGLNTVFRILDRHGASAILNSTAGRGTSVDLYFPKIAWKVENENTEIDLQEEQDGPPVFTQDSAREFHLVNGGLSSGAGPAQAPPSPGEELGTILLVDDEEMVARVTALGLQRQGYRVIKHLDSRVALTDFIQTPDLFDVVITDQIMPHMSGVRLARKIHGVRPNIPVILITGVRDSFNDQQTMEAGIAQIVLKPVSHRDLADVVEKVRLRRREIRG